MLNQSVSVPHRLQAITPCTPHIGFQLPAVSHKHDALVVAWFLEMLVYPLPPCIRMYPLAPLLLQSGTLLPLLHQCLEEDWYADVRGAACSAVEQLLDALQGEGQQAARRAVCRSCALVSPVHMPFISPAQTPVTLYRLLPSACCCS